MNWLLRYISKLMTTANTIGLPPFFKWVLKSLQDHSGKTSGKRLAGANAMGLVTYMVWHGVHYEKVIDGGALVALLSFAAAAFAIDYLPGGTNKKEINKEQQSITQDSVSSNQSAEQSITDSK